MVREEKQRQRAHLCPHCLTGFQSPSDRDRHARAVHEKCRDHACPHCDAAFGEVGVLTRHGRTVHELSLIHI